MEEIKGFGPGDAAPIRKAAVISLIHRINEHLKSMRREISKLRPCDEVLVYDCEIDFTLTKEEIKFIGKIYTDAGWAALNLHQNTGSVASLDNYNIDFRFVR